MKSGKRDRQHFQFGKLTFKHKKKKTMKKIINDSEEEISKLNDILKEKARFNEA